MAASRMFEQVGPGVAALLLAVMATGAEPEVLAIGRPLEPELLAAKDFHVFPDGRGLPKGSGTARQGAPLYAAKCAACHGDEGQGVGDFVPLVGGVGSLNSAKPLLTVGSYWPHATTLFDYVRRAMPYHSAGELSDDEVYALVAWILAANRIIEPAATMNRKTLPKVKMPNQQGFDIAPR